MNGIFNLYKPPGITSHGVVNWVRRATGIRKVGHTGTLDPDAQGVLPVCIGKGTKVSGLLMDSDKAYHATVVLGSSTTTQDSGGEIICTSAKKVTAQEICSVVSSFVGELSQLPPMYSAIKKNGKKLYEYARKGIEVAREPRYVKIYSIEVSNIEENSFEIDVACSKGTYIRTLCNDIGEALGTYAHMGRLIRTKSSQFKIENAVPMEDFQQLCKQGEVHKILIPIDQLFQNYPKIILSSKDEFRVRNGNYIFHSGKGRIFRIYTQDNTFLALYQSVIKEGIGRVLVPYQCFF